MTLNIAHVRGKGGMVGERPCNFAGVFVLDTCICVPSFKPVWLVVVERTH